MRRDSYTCLNIPRGEKSISSEHTFRIILKQLLSSTKSSTPQLSADLTLSRAVQTLPSPPRRRHKRLHHCCNNYPSSSLTTTAVAPFLHLKAPSTFIFITPHAKPLPPHHGRPLLLLYHCPFSPTGNSILLIPKT